MAAQRNATTRNYLRVRGEYGGGLQYRGPLGTTSACAENTAGVGATAFCFWNYLRVRGEYLKLSNNYC